MLAQGRIKALGTMSGTSLDGVDAAVLDTDGEAIFGFGPTRYLAYSDTEKAVVRAVFGEFDSYRVAAAAEIVETAHARVLSQFEDFAVVGFHGQTVAHDPEAGRTNQIGDGQVLAEVMQKPIVWDFRSADMQMGGQGAPLAPFYHYALVKYLQRTTPVAVLNLGGVGNVTWVDPVCDAPQDDGALLAFDTGPANAPIDDAMQRLFQLPFDRNGETASKGAVDAAVIERFLELPYFRKMPPKSLDRNEFQGLVTEASGLSAEDCIATLTQAVTASVAGAVTHFPTPVDEILVCGGGRKNKHLIEQIEQVTGHRVVPIDDYGINGDMLEAQAFAYLAVRVARGLPTSCPSTTGVAAAIGGGTISVPRGS